MPPTTWTAIAALCTLALVASPAHAIAGGEPVFDTTEFPFLVAVFSTSPAIRGPGFHCAGIVLDSRHVITAAHCIAMATPDQLVIVHGTTDVSLGVVPGVPTIAVCSIEAHPAFDVPVLNNDVAVLTLSEDLPASVVPVTLDQCSTPDCVTEPVAPGTPVTAVGWGFTESGLAPGSMIARKVSLVVSDCAQTYSPGDLGEARVCSLPLDGAGGSCYGDDGGPLLVQRSPGQYALVGILSYQLSTSCGAGHPTIATATPTFSDFFQPGIGLPPPGFADDVCTFTSGVCPAGTMDDGGVCTPCPGNFAASATWGVCETCPKGSIAVAAPGVPKFHGRPQTSSCQKCPRGTFHASPDDTFCTQCPPFTSTHDDGQISCDWSCPEGATNPYPTSGTLEMQMYPHLDDFSHETSLSLTRVDNSGSTLVYHATAPIGSLPLRTSVPAGVYWLAGHDSTGDGAQRPVGLDSYYVDGYFAGERPSQYTFTHGSLVGVGVDFCRGYGTHTPSQATYVPHIVANAAHVNYHTDNANLDGVWPPEQVYLDASSMTVHWYTTLFSPPRTVHRGSTPVPVPGPENQAGSTQVADLNGDGRDDVIVVHRSGLIAWLTYNDATDSLDFQPDILDDSSTDTMTAYPVDMDNDGRMDVVSADFSGVNIRVHYNDFGDGSSWTTVPIASIGPNFVSHVWAADVNADGFSDVLVPFRDGLYVITANPSGGFGSPVRIAQTSPVHRVRAADFNNDGHMDLVFSLFEEHKVAMVFGPAPYSPVMYLAGDVPGVRGMDIGDLDGDGSVDVVAADADSSITTAYFWHNDGTGSFGEPSSLPQLSALRGAHDVQVTDADGDGHNDILVGGLGTVVMFLHTEVNDDSSSGGSGSGGSSSGGGGGGSDSSGGGGGGGDCHGIVPGAFWYHGEAVMNYPCNGCTPGPVIGNMQFWRPPLSAVAYQEGPLECA